MFSIRTHLGHLLKAGDLALGYDLYGANCNDIELDKYRGHIPEVILIKKSYEEIRQKTRGKPRSWKLKSLPMEVDDKVRVELDHEQFLNDLEENSDLRSNIPLHKNKEYQPSEVVSLTDDEKLLMEKLMAFNLYEDEYEEDHMEE
ncbi:uncharacterized protein [Cicer arietinum]|uniref:60S ribosomal export protein NMD3-like n=1 Tax=Cicer arietinum TaxID=3827 RepID=A0A1S2XZB1_CICAR|nr:60S ribosomal export protein NMD3-like [Cicer arietinum]